MSATDTTPAAALKMWRASVIRKKLDRLGRVWAADRATAVAVAEFRFDDHQRKRLLIEEVRFNVAGLCRRSRQLPW